VQIPTPYVVIRWPWLSYLIVEVALSGIFLIAVTASAATTRACLLRGSTLATLCALDEPTRKSLGHIGDYENLRRRGTTVRVRLVDGPDDGLALTSLR